MSCSPCKASIVEGGNNGVSFTYDDPLCKKVRVYVPKGKAFSFRHLEGSIQIDEGTYTLISKVDKQIIHSVTLTLSAFFLSFCNFSEMNDPALSVQLYNP